MANEEMDQDLLQQLYMSGHIDKAVLDRVVSSPPVEDGTPSAIAEVASEAAAQGEGPNDLIEKIKPYLVRQESGGDTNAVSAKGARGIMQVMPETAMETAKKMGMKKYDLFDKDQNEAIGSHYLGEQLDKFGGDMELALAAYNGGPNRVQKLLDRTGGTSFDDIKKFLPEETRDYVTKINGYALKGEGLSLKDLSGKGGQAPPAMMAKSQAKPGIMQQIGDMLIPSAEAQENDAVGQEMAQAENAPAPIVDDPAQAQALAQAQLAAQNADPAAALAALGLGQEVSPTNQRISDAFALQQQGAEGAAQAKIAGAEATAKAYQDSAVQIAKAGVDYNEKYQKAALATQQDLDRFRQKVLDFNSTSIDPNRLFKSQSTWSTILLGLSGALQAASGDTAGGMKLVNDAINRDIDIQKANLSLKKQDIDNEISLMGANEAQLRSINAAEYQTRSQMLSYANATVNQLAANTNSELAKSNLQTISGTIQQQQLALEQKMTKQVQDANNAAMLEEATNEGLSPAQAKLQSIANNDDRTMNLLVQDLDGKPAALSPNIIARKAATEAILKKKEMNGYITDLRKMYEEYGNPTFVGDKANFDSINKTYNMLKQAAVVSNISGGSLGRYVTLETDLANAMFPPDIIAKSFIGAAKNAAYRKVFKDDFLNILDQAEKLYNNKLAGAIEQSTSAGTRTPEFKKWLAKEKAMKLGADSKGMSEE